MAGAKNRKRNFILLLVASCFLAMVAGYAAATTELGAQTWDWLMSLAGGGETSPPETEKPGENLGEEPGDTPGENPEEKPDEEPNEEPGKEPGDEPDTIIIYEGQVLLIPGAGGSVSAAQIVTKGVLPGQEKRIALTFDSGWLYELTIPLLDTLEEHGVTATFFPRGYWVEDHPELAQEIVRRGHTMGNHSLTHPHMREMTTEEIRHELRESTRIIQQVTGVRPYLFRPPYGEYNQLVLDILGEEGYPYTIMWTVDTHDWAEEIGGHKVTVDYIVERTLNNASDNGIVLMHVGGANTVQALPRIIEGLRKEGYTFTTVDKMLPAPAEAPQTHVVSKGETLYSIARQYNVTVEQLVEINGL